MLLNAHMSYVPIQFKSSQSSTLKKVKSCYLFSSAYSGPPLKVYLGTGSVFRNIIKFSQYESDEKDKTKNCINYPNDVYKSYTECDEINAYLFMKHNFGLVPFWTTNNLSDITRFM